MVIVGGMLRLLRVLGSRRPRGRALLSVLGIALGVALGYGVYLVNRAAVDELAAAVRGLAGEADLEVRGGRGGFSESLYPAIARLPGVASVSPGLELDAGLAGTERTIRVIGIDALRERRPELLTPDRVLLSAAAAELVKGDRLRLAIGHRMVELQVGGVLDIKGVEVLTDIATAQWRLERLGRLNRLDVRLKRGAEREAVRSSIAALLPPGVHVASVEALEQASSYPSRAYRVNLNVLAMVALFTGGFLVFSAQALEVARRRGEHALLRVLGLQRRGVLRLVLLEAAALGAIGGLLGLGLGYALGLAAVRASGADLGAGMFRGLSPKLDFSFVPAFFYLAAGIAVAVAGALLPALDAARRPPAQALKAGDEQRLFARVSSPWPGLAFILAGAALAQLGPVGGLPIYGYAAIGCLLIGSFSLMAAMAIMIASFRQSLDDWLNAVLPAELYFRTSHAGDTGYLEPGFEDRVRALPQVARADFLRSGRILLDPARPPLVLIARDRAEKAFPKVGVQYTRRPGDPPRVWVSEAVGDLFGFSAGQRIELPINGKSVSLIVAGLFRDYARQHGSVLIDRGDYAALTGDRRVNDAALWLAPGATPAQAMDAIRALPGSAGIDLGTPGEIRQLSLRIFDRSFAVTYAMEAVAVLVGLFGLSSSLGAIVLARRREFGMLRHLGLTRAQIRAMLAAEGGLLALLGALAGLAAGAAISLVLVYVVNRQSFNWSMELHVPFLLLAGLIALLIFLAVITAIVSGREAMGIGPVRAVREDW